MGDPAEPARSAHSHRTLAREARAAPGSAMGEMLARHGRTPKGHDRSPGRGDRPRPRPGLRSNHLRGLRDARGAGPEWLGDHRPAGLAHLPGLRWAGGGRRGGHVRDWRCRLARIRRDARESSRTRLPGRHVQPADHRRRRTWGAPPRHGNRRGHAGGPNPSYRNMLRAGFRLGYLRRNWLPPEVSAAS